MVSPAEGNSNRDNNKRRGEESNKHNATPENPLNMDGLLPPDLGAVLGEGTYAVAKLNEGGEPEKIVSAGKAQLHENGISVEQQLNETMLLALGVKTTEEAHRALRGDGADSGSSSVSVGYNKKYAQGWSSIWGSSN